MLGRMVEIAEDNRHLSMHRGFLLVNETAAERRELGRIPLDDITALIASAHGLSYTHNVLVALTERGAPFVLCGRNHNVVGVLLSLDGNFEQAKRFDAQIQSGQPLRKRLWATVVKSKTQQQSAALDALGVGTPAMQLFASRVRSGDPENIEAQAARRYWGLLFGENFRRNRDDGSPANSLLNYAYTVLRACTARAVVAAGLHPTLSLHHSNASNPLRLVDDLMEPFRPLMDLHVKHLLRAGVDSVTASAKRELVSALYADMHTDVGVTPLCVCIQRLATSLALVYTGEADSLALPLPGLPLDFQPAFDG